MATVFGPSAAERVKYLAALADLDERELPLAGDESYSIVGKTPSVDGELERIRGTITEKFSRLLQVLVAAGVLTREEADKQSPQIEFEVIDMREPGKAGRHAGSAEAGHYAKAAAIRLSPAGPW
jgi:hypothetical protein